MFRIGGRSFNRKKVLFEGVVRGTVDSISHQIHNVILKLDERITGLPDKISIYGIFRAFQIGDKMQVDGTIYQNPMKLWKANHIIMLAKYFYNDTNQTGYGKHSKGGTDVLFKGELTGKIVSPPFFYLRRYESTDRYTIDGYFIFELDLNIQGIPKKIHCQVSNLDPWSIWLNLGDRIRVSGKIIQLYLVTWQTYSYYMRVKKKIYFESA